MRNTGLFKRFKDQRGNVAVTVALCAVPILLLSFGAIDFGMAAHERSLLQNAVDSGALAGATRLTVAGSTGGQQTVEATATNVARQALLDAHITTLADFTVTLDAQGAVTVNGQMKHQALTGFLGYGDQTLTAHATAETLASVPLCVLQTGEGGITLKDKSSLQATGCAVHANENIQVDQRAVIHASRTQAVGTITGPVSPAGNMGALPITDPFASMNLHPPMDCAGKPVTYKEETGTTLILQPGVHCEHFIIDKDATLILQPGDHYFMDDLEAKENAIIRGDDVVLIFGSTKKINFADRASVELGARRSGPFSGFLIITTRDNHEKFTISSDHVSKLLGTIYIPEAELDVETAGNVAQDSAWSIIVADTLHLEKGPALVINANYVGSGVPVPDGVGPGRSQPVLSR
ncbi:MAG TPA: TadE/TadG family type IV pilus assembly protein [Asticcacaulis sp.]|nr:TadE/TadG family type IV pilus assembly protein [Asticcacaulis sp.]